MTGRAREGVQTGAPDDARARLVSDPRRPERVRAAGHELHAVAGRRAPEGSRDLAGELDAARGGGVALPQPGRADLERGLATDLGAVRLHKDAQVDVLADVLGASAFTTGDDVFLHRSAPSPETSAGRRLLAHEVIHVLQQRQGPVEGAPGPGGLLVSHPSDRHESAASRGADLLERGGRIDPVSSATATAREGIGRRPVLVQRQDISTPVVNAGPAPGVNPIPAFNALDAWRVNAAQLITGTWAWETGNWIDFITRTSSNSHLTLGDSELAGVASNALGNLLTELGSDVIKTTYRESAEALGALIGTALVPAAGTVMGFLLGVLIESAASWAFENVTGVSDANQMSDETSERIRKILAQEHTLLAAQHADAIAQLEGFIAEAKLNAEHAETQADVDSIATWATAEAAKTEVPKPELDRSMSESLLRIWVLERAGNVGSAHGADTSAGQWAEALALAYGGATRVENQPALFVFQTRAEWEKAGLNHTALTDAMMSQALELAAGGGADPARAVQAAFHGKTFDIRVKDPVAFVHYVSEHHFKLVGSGTSMDIISEGRVWVDCTLDVAVSHGSAYIDEWNWHVTFEKLDPLLPPWDLYVARFDVWPSWGPLPIPPP